MFNIEKKKIKEKEDDLFKGKFVIKLSNLSKEKQEDFRKNFKRLE